MSIERFYKNINLYRYNEGSFNVPAGYSFMGTFKGLIQTPSNGRAFTNGKNTSNVSGVLFCPVSVKFENKDIIEYCGQKYIISGQNTQSDGVTGITPKRGQHAEYRLEWTQQGI